MKIFNPYKDYVDTFKGKEGNELTLEESLSKFFWEVVDEQFKKDFPEAWERSKKEEENEA